MRVLAPRAFSCHVKVFNYSDDGVQAWERDGKTMGYDLKTCLQNSECGGLCRSAVCGEGRVRDDRGEYPRYAELFEGVAGDGLREVLQHRT